MRRCKDDWVNATQILKCCNFAKAKRTKILEKGVQQGLHEKIQGGFGRFQGTWIPLPDAQRLAESFGVTAEMAPVLYIDVKDPSQIPPRVASSLTPVKRKYTKKVKKPEETPTKKQRTTKKASQAGPDTSQDLSHMNSYTSVTRQDSYMSSQGSLGGPPESQGQSQQPTPQQLYQLQQQQLQQQQVPPHQMPPTFSHAEFIPSNGNMGHPHPQHLQKGPNDFQNYQVQLQRLQLQQHQQQQQQQQQLQQLQLQDSQEQKYYQQFTPNGSQIIGQPQIIGNFQQNPPKTSLSQSTNETNWSQDDNSRPIAKDSDTSVSSIDESSQSIKSRRAVPTEGNEDDTYASKLLKFFSEDNGEIPYFIHNPPYDFNINEPIDDEGHTPLHWSASIGNYHMIHILLSKGASPLVVNNFGLNPLSKLVSFNNCFELQNFPKVLDDLELCLINTDINGRTPLHYICQFSKMKSKHDSLRYYVNHILNKLSSLSSQNPSKQVDLLKNVLDHQDVNGDTCLHLAARSGSSKIARYLLDHGSRDDLENIHKETAKSLMKQFEIVADYSEPSTMQRLQPSQMSFQGNEINQGNQGNQTQRSNFLPPPQDPRTHSQQRNSITAQPNSITTQFNDMIPPHVDAQYQILATPVQPHYSNGVETPDTQRTTIQVDEADEDDLLNSTRIDKSQLETLIKIEDNKENIFIENFGLKGYDSMSTPIQKNPALSNNPSNQFPYPQTHQPLAVISERTVESTPIHDKRLYEQSTQQTHRPNPPQLDDEGNIIKPATANSSKLLMTDLSSMVSGMINSLSDTYSQEVDQFEKDQKKLTTQLEDKQTSNQTLLSNFMKLLARSGIENVDDVSQGKALVVNEINSLDCDVKEKEQTLSVILKKNQISQLSALIQSNELQQIDQSKSIDTDDDLMNEEQFNYAVELTQLQYKRDELMEKVTRSMKNFGIDSKMYKYRKLISLSCGLKVEEIDSLIDGIEESLVEASN